MGKLEILPAKETEARLRMEWKLDEGAVYSSTYARTFVEENHSLLPEPFAARDVRQLVNCPEAVVAVSFVIDPQESNSAPPVKNIPCESHPDQPKQSL